MDDGQLKTSARDEMPAISQSRSLPGRLQTSELLAFTNHNQLHAYDSIDEGEGRTSRSNSMLSKANSFTPRTASRKGESPAELPGVPTSVNADFQTQGDGGSEYDVSGHIAPLVRRSSQNKPGTSDVFRNFRVHPVFSNLVVNSRKGSSELDDTLITTLADEPSSDVNHTRLSKMLSLHKVHIASRNDTVVKLPVGGTEQPHDPSVHRMIFFRTKKELNELFLLPPVSLWERRFNRTVFTLIMLGVGDLAIETCDGPNYGSTDPGYPYLPTEQQHEVYDGVFAGLFTLEFLIRGIQAKSIRAVVHDPYMWLDLIGISPWYILEVLKAAGNTVGPGHFINMLRLIRLVRLALILRHYEQTKVMYLAIKASLRPLGITLFFLFTLVMIFATAIFYSEPCYNVETCTFTDIFNSAYFVMVTVATVGYGHQVPSLKNPGSLLLTMLVMILGEIYFSMPVAIIGNNFQLTYENFQMDKKKKSRYLNVSLSPFDFAIVPFFAEVSGYMFAHIKPDYAIVATSPSFLSVIRVLKIMRILKLTRHFRGTKILAATAIKVWKPLVIPLFFLFTGCIIAGAVFYEIERGKECFVGEPCWWWGKNVLTPELAAGLPVGKRILIQDKVKTIITDMIHSTWLSYATLTSVGYGDLVPRTSIGKFFDVFVIIVATIYSAMPLSLVGSQFYSLYEKHLEKVVVKQGGSSVSWRTKTTISLVTQYKKTTKHHSARKPEPFMLSDEQLLVVHEFESMRRTILNLQRTLDAATVTTLESAQR
ncbi:hypothetical protein PF005_g4077 [Phytophthora fragariae]|uniref:Ion transport domain-containing protein n=1 Tax=Phytophthora fragariae TaxID=53985 RepID=A0A6A3LZK6_9STRA|nr:hypothetical protein PF009_g4580 [Phytophthora fragariae]KAE9024602.1 hypothetical protein PF011_g3431 [Phytophthora fragariae]KAE9130704.1 hypothetical protein PF007_g4407 [Phytophthora fragariae]KAE9152125.1 hypothetical protein PF006_g3631 [Phytophthora fragariae]KAE9228956.1 hypothetical protein PF005_g4077 [Phytophthora fragariae]